MGSLKERKAYPNAAGELPSRTPFSLLFRGPRTQELIQRTFVVRHDVIGEFLLFIVPVHADDRGFLYEALFN